MSNILRGFVASGYCVPKFDADYTTTSFMLHSMTSFSQEDNITGIQHYYKDDRLYNIVSVCGIKKCIGIASYCIIRHRNCRTRSGTIAHGNTIPQLFGIYSSQANFVSIASIQSIRNLSILSLHCSQNNGVVSVYAKCEDGKDYPGVAHYFSIGVL